jgi:hypothetical protein
MRTPIRPLAYLLASVASSLTLASAHGGLAVTNYLVADTQIIQNGTTPQGSAGTVLSGTTGGLIYRTLFKAHGPDVPDGCVLTNATLYLYQDWSAGYSKVVDLYRMLNIWTQSAATWYSNTTSTAWNSPGLASGTDYAGTATTSVTTPAADGFTIFNVTTDVLAFVAGTTDNFGWVCRAHTESQLVRFRTIEDTVAAKWPYVVYEYNTPSVSGTIVTNPVTHDTQVDAANPNANAGAGTAMHVGVQSSAANRSLVRSFVTNLPPTAIVLSAQLRCYQDYTTGGGDLIDAYRVLQPWTQNEATWNSNTTTTAWTTPGLGAGTDRLAAPSDTSYAPPLAQQIFFDVTADVSAFLAGTATDHGWVLINQVETGTPVARFRTSEYGIVDQRPYLIIRYKLPTGALITVR